MELIDQRYADERIAVARRFFEALAAADASAALTCLAPGAVLWQNYDRIEKPLAQRVSMIGRFGKLTDYFGYADSRVEAIAGGVLIRHIMIARFDGGQGVQVPMIVHLTFAGHGIARAEEYLDSAQMAPFAAFVQRVLAAD